LSGKTLTRYSSSTVSLNGSFYGTTTGTPTGTTGTTITLCATAATASV
jgi:hypothetical protein